MIPQSNHQKGSVKQDNLLIPALFNLALDSALFEVDVLCRGLADRPKARQLVYAHDMKWHFASDLSIMQERVNKLVSSLRGLVFKINPKKYHLLHLMSNKKNKFSYIHTDLVCTINDVPVSVWWHGWCLLVPRKCIF